MVRIPEATRERLAKVGEAMSKRALTELPASVILHDGGDVAANVRAHRRVFERLGFFAEDHDGSLWAFDLASPVEEPPVVGLDTEGQYAWLRVDLAQAFARDEEVAWVATQFLPSLGDLQVRYHHEEKGSPMPPARRSARVAVADDPVSWLAQPGAEVAAVLGRRVPARGPIAKCDDEGLVFTIWLPREGPLSRLSARGITRGSPVAAVRRELGAPTKEGARWLRFDEEAIALHFEIDGDAVARITLMTAPSIPR
jgi:hypothetical protein